MFITNQKAIQITEELVATHAPLILEDLGLTNEDGVLDRIIISDKASAEGMAGYCEALFERRGPFGPLKYKNGSSKITLYPMTLFRSQFSLRITVFTIYRSEKMFRRFMTKAIAHELRHYWQYVTGKYHQNHGMLGDLVPYKQQWCEIDANKYQEHYYKGGVLHV